MVVGIEVLEVLPEQILLFLQAEQTLFQSVLDIDDFCGPEFLSQLKRGELVFYLLVEILFEQLILLIEEVTQFSPNHLAVIFLLLLPDIDQLVPQLFSFLNNFALILGDP